MTTISFGTNALTPLGPTERVKTSPTKERTGLTKKLAATCRKHSGSPPTYDAYQAESAVDKGVGSPNETDPFSVWFPGITPQQRTTNITRDAYSNACADVGGCP